MHPQMHVLIPYHALSSSAYAEALRLSGYFSDKKREPVCIQTDSLSLFRHDSAVPMPDVCTEYAEVSLYFSFAPSRNAFPAFSPSLRYVL